MGADDPVAEADELALDALVDDEAAWRRTRPDPSTVDGSAVKALPSISLSSVLLHVWRLTCLKHHNRSCRSSGPNSP